MRTACLTMTVAVALSLVPGFAHAEKRATMPQDVGPGRVAWFDITTTDLAKSKEFYGKLFGWQFAPVQGTDQAVEIVSRGVGIGTIRGAEGAIAAFNGVIYVQVPDIQAACRKAKDLAGTIVEGFPFNLPDGTGAIAVATDPSGHPFGMYSRSPIPPTSAPAK